MNMLTERELEILNLLASGECWKDTQKKLFISEATAKRDMLNIRNKLGAKNKVHAVAIAIKKGIIQQEIYSHKQPKLAQEIDKLKNSVNEILEIVNSYKPVYK